MPTLFEVKKANRQGCPNCKSLRFYIRDDRLGGGFRCYDCGHLWGENRVEKDDEEKPKV